MNLTHAIGYLALSLHSGRAKEYPHIETAIDVPRHSQPLGIMIVQMDHWLFEGIPNLSIYSVDKKAGAGTDCGSKGERFRLAGGPTSSRSLTF